MNSSIQIKQGALSTQH